MPQVVLTTSSTIDLPPLKYGPFRHSIGEIVHVLNNGGQVQVISEEEIKISPRKLEKAYNLSNGQKIIFTYANKVQRPANVDGVVQVDENGKLKWISHRLIDEMAQDILSRGLPTLAADISNGWIGKFFFRAEIRDASGQITTSGLRPPQIGGLHAIGSHWSIHQQPATIVMPTGTGKTETMLATLVSYNTGKILVIVPSQVLREQTVKKFCSLGLLRKLGCIPNDLKNPIVGIIRKRPQQITDLDIFDKCNVIIATMSALSDESTSALVPTIASKIGALIVDEAHHIAAKGWSAFKEHFANNKILQFTATPYRRDGKLVDGKVIYSYPLNLAQKDGYFKKINFEPVYEIEQINGDRAIATAAIEKLRSDREQQRDHLIMARCENIARATEILPIYQELGAEFNPVLIHSEDSASEDNLARLFSRESRIVICVNMLGEGFDLPQLKIAAVHDTHKSLAILLQFTGRFTRTLDNSIGDATIIANIADQNVSSALERLYSEDADWNQLLSEFSSEAARTHAELVEFLNSSERLDESDDDDKIEISHHLLRPTFNTCIFEAADFTPERFFDGLPKELIVHRVWLHRESNTLYFVTRFESPIKWTRSRNIKDRIWDLFVIHFDATRNLLHVFSSDKSSNHFGIANAVGATSAISGDVIFRALGRINRLIFQNVGVKKHGRRNLRFALYTGSDVVEALSVSERAGSVKSNLSGTGWENGEPITIGCSYKGRVWARDPGTIPELVDWCENIGDKIKDTTIDTTQIIANVLIPEEVSALPDKVVLGIDWPLEIIRQSEERVVLYKDQFELSISMFDLEIQSVDTGTNSIIVILRSSADQVWGEFRLVVGGDEGFKVTQIAGSEVTIRVGTLRVKLDEYFSNYPPLIRFVDLSELDGNLLIHPQHPQELIFPAERFETWDWTGTDIRKESIWKDDIERRDSIQWKVAQQYITGGFDVVFDDDSAGEAADLVCLKEETDFIHLVLIHCKFTTSSDTGERIKDVVEVSSQAVRSAKWKWKFKDLCLHILGRERRLVTANRQTRFMSGHASDLNKFMKISRFKEIKPQIIIVQPGLSQANHTPDQAAVLASAYSYLKETIGVDLDVICSS